MRQFNIDPEAPDDILGENPPYDDWFHNPLDDMPIATDNPRPEEEIADDWFSDKPKEKDKTIHQSMYEIATAKYNPFAVGGTESIHDFEGGSENGQKL